MPAAPSKRVLWKGAISFGLVHIPIALHSAVDSNAVDFDWLDRRSMEPVGYKRINKITGKEIDRQDIVKGIATGDGEYVVLEAGEIAAAYPRTTQTVEIEAFVPLDSIPFVYLERPYYVSPINKGGKVYALLREVLAESRLAGLAKVVIQTKQHLALLFACGPVLILNLLRWGDEVRDWSALNLPDLDRGKAGLTSRELKMARQLVDDMTMDWRPDQFTDSFREQIMQLVQEKIEAGETSEVTQPEPEEEETGGARIYDLADMLQRSLKGRKPAVGGGADSGQKAGHPARPSGSASASRARKRAAKTAAGDSAKEAVKKTASRSATSARKTTTGRTAARKSVGKTGGKRKAA